MIMENYTFEYISTTLILLLITVRLVKDVVCWPIVHILHRKNSEIAKKEKSILLGRLRESVLVTVFMLIFVSIFNNLTDSGLSKLLVITGSYIAGLFSIILYAERQLLTTLLFNIIWILFVSGLIKEYGYRLEEAMVGIGFIIITIYLLILIKEVLLVIRKSRVRESNK